MRPGRILHPELAKALATCGHTDIILVTDAGFPIPKDANRIDLGYYAGQADLLDILRMLRKEIFVEEVAFAPEVKTHHPALYKDLQEIYTGSGAVFKGIPHEELVAEIAPKAKVIIRSGSLNAWGNIALTCSTGCKVLVITPIDGDALGSVLKTAKEDGVEVINYDRMITNTDAVSYLATFDNTVVGEKQGEYIVDKLDLENTDQTFNLEIVSGDPGDNNATYFYNGAMSILQPYIDSGKLVVKSGQVSKDDTATANWDTEKAQSRMDAIIASYYADGTNLDAVLCSNDSTALGTANALESSYTGSWPIITGQDCDIANVKNIVKGKQTMSVFKDTRKLAKVTVKMVNSIMKGEEVEVNDTITYDNGAKVIPTYVVDPIAVDQDNYKEILIEGGYYTEAELQ